MLADISNVDAIYIVCGRTDMRKSIDGLYAIIKDQFSMELDHSLYLFCGRKCDRIKAILKEPDGIVLIYKKLTASQGSYRWPRNKSEVRNLTSSHLLPLVGVAGWRRLHLIDSLCFGYRLHEPEIREIFFKVYDSLFSLDAVYRIRHRRTQGAADNRNKGYQ